MFQNRYICTGCRETLESNVGDTCYYAGTEGLDKEVADTNLLALPVRPAWCKDCQSICVAEDIAPVRAFEDAYGAVRGGRLVEYPIHTENWKPEEALRAVEWYLRWRMTRRHPARALCCGGTNYQFMDVALPLFKHAGCESGVIEPAGVFIGPYCGSGPGVHSAANIRVYDSEGELIGRLTWRKRDEDKWEVEPAKYDPIHEDGS